VLWWIRRKLNSEDWRVRLTAAETLASRGQQDGLQVLLDALGDADSRVRDAAGKALDRLKYEPDLPDQRARYAVTRERYDLAAAQGSVAVPFLVERLVDTILTKNTQAERSVAEAIAKIGPSAAAELASRLAHEDVRVCERLTLLLGRTGDPNAVGPLAEQLKRPSLSSTVRAATMRALAQLGGTVACRSLASCLRDSDSSNRLEAASSLSLFGPSEVLDSVSVAYQGEQDPTVRSVLAKTLAGWNWKPQESRERIRFLIELGDVEGVLALGQIAVEPLVEFLKSADSASRKSAAAVLHRIIDPKHVESFNLIRWRISGRPIEWVAEHCGKWSHSDWLSLIEGLKGSEFWPIREEDIGKEIERHKSDWATARRGTAPRKVEIKEDRSDRTILVVDGGSLEGVSLAGAKLRRAYLGHENLTGADFSDADLIEAALQQASMVGTRFVGAVCRDASFSFSNATGVDLRRADLRSASFDQATLPYADLREADCSGTGFAGADLKNADLRGAKLRSATLRGADLHGARLEGTVLEGAIYDDQTRWPAEFAINGMGMLLICSGAGLKGADLEHSDLSGARLQGADLRGANLSRAYFNSADLSGADLRGASIRGANFENAILVGAKLAGLAFDGVSLVGANLEKADLTGIDLMGARYHPKSTRWPQGFDPVAYAKSAVRPAASPQPDGPKGSGVSFVRKYTKEIAEGTRATYELYRADAAEVAKEFLLTKRIPERLQYVVVETPGGIWGIDIDGIYLEKLLPWQLDLGKAEVEGRTEGAADRHSLIMAARGNTDNYLQKVVCGRCAHEWLDGVRYCTVTLVRCPKCQALNSIAAHARVVLSS